MTNNVSHLISPPILPCVIFPKIRLMHCESENDSGGTGGTMGGIGQKCGASREKTDPSTVIHFDVLTQIHRTQQNRNDQKNRNTGTNKTLFSFPVKRMFILTVV